MTNSNVTIIEARGTGLANRLMALWRYRAFYPLLFKELTMRRIATRMLLGFWWLIIRPGVPIALAVIVFTFFIPLETYGLPYAVFLLSGFVLWRVFSRTVVMGARTLGWGRGLMRRTYFPKMLVPLAGIGRPLIETAIVAVFYIGALVYYQVTTGTLYLHFGWPLLLFPLCFALALTLALAIAMVVGVIALFLPDMRFGIRFFAQFMAILTPVFYPVTLINEDWRWVAYINPMTSVIETGRWSLTGFGEFHPMYLAISIATILAILTLCMAFFFRAETYLGDEL